MKHSITRAALIAVMAAGAACAEPTAAFIDVPDDLLPVSLVTGEVRTVASAPEPPRVTLEAVSNGLRFKVTRSWLCAMIGSAGYQIQSVGASTMTIVASVSPNPAALCAAVVGEQDYSGTVPATSGRTYTVRFYEQVGDGRARLLRTESVTAQ